MSDPKQHPMWARCDEKGIAWAKHLLHTEGHIPTRQVVLAWLEFAEREERLQSEQKQHDLNERSVNAATTSARAAIVAVIVSFFALVVAIAALIKQP